MSKSGHKILKRLDKPFKKTILRGYLFECAQCKKEFKDTMELNISTREWETTCPHCGWHLPTYREDE